MSLRLKVNETTEEFIWYLHCKYHGKKNKKMKKKNGQKRTGTKA